MCIRDSYNADILWFTRGYVEYAIPNFIPASKKITQITISAELSSEAPGTNNAVSYTHLARSGAISGIPDTFTLTSSLRSKIPVRSSFLSLYPCLLYTSAADISQLRMVQWAFRVILFICGTRLTIIGEENVPKDQPVLYIGNHRSYFDIIITDSRCPRLTGYVAKDSMKKVPLLSCLLYTSRCV